MPDPIIDPATGKPKEPPEGDPNARPEFVKKEDYDALKSRLDAFEAGARSAQHSEPAPLPPPPDTSFKDQITEIDTEVGKLNTKIDEAVSDGKPVSALMTERDNLVHKRTRLQIKHEDIDPALSAGMQTIDQLSDTVTKSGMTYLDIVKTDYEETLNSLPPDQRMNPQVRQFAYERAVGKNIEKIKEAQKEELLRSTSPPQDGDVPTSSARDGGDGKKSEIPKPEDVLSREAISAAKKYSGSVDAFYQKRGYKGWDDFWEKRGKAYFSEEEEAA